MATPTTIITESAKGEETLLPALCWLLGDEEEPEGERDPDAEGLEDPDPDEGEPEEEEEAGAWDPSAALIENCPV